MGAGCILKIHSVAVATRMLINYMNPFSHPNGRGGGERGATSFTNHTSFYSVVGFFVKQE